MKALYTILLSIFILTNYLSVAQKTTPSRIDTESWLLEKMNKYVAKNTIDCRKLSSDVFSKTTDCSTYTNVRFTLSGDNLIINFSVEKTEYNDNGNVKSNFSRKVKVPLYDLSDDFYITTNSLSFATKYMAITIEDSNGKSQKSSFFKLWFNDQEEENFRDRFNKAMNHLRTFIKKPKSKEVF